MRVVIGWMAALFASALLGAVVYETVLSQPLPEPGLTADVATTGIPQPRTTVHQTEVRKVIEPTPTITVIEEVVAPVAPAPVRTTTAKALSPRASNEDAKEKRTTSAKEREDSEHESEHESEDSEHESEEAEHDERESDDD